MFTSVLDFWFKETDPSLWWAKNETFDQLIATRFADLHQQACRCELFAWRNQPRGRLAEILILDQFSRNLFRDSPRAFAQDPLALALAQEAIAAGADQPLTPVERSFLYLPFMHSESPLIHQTAVTLYDQPGLEFNLDFEHQHKAIIDRFGRYPHRNTLLGRESTPEEILFLKQPGSSF
ncbi:DUF924 family protein [Leeia oryzae]|uniref:DUF924 family protein n=1 Tax=Leeia oryzae TaxID=356662 RepID=UPI0003781601|nr:DUF924 family protein [Leeia oryzae]